MNYINPPTNLPTNMTHKTYYSQILNNEVGYNIYLPPEYWDNEEKYPVVYHIHGWQGNESSEIWSIENVYRNRQAITVFMNSISSENEYFNALLQIESILIKELIPHIEGQYRASTNRMLSGFSMGGAMAFYYAVKYSNLFNSVTTYAGTYHHQYHKDYSGIGEPPERATELYEKMIQEEQYLEEKNILNLVHENADRIRTNLHIDIHIGTSDIVFCDNEIMHLYLNSLGIVHQYIKFMGIGHDLGKII